MKRKKGYSVIGRSVMSINFVDFVTFDGRAVKKASFVKKGKLARKTFSERENLMSYHINNNGKRGTTSHDHCDLSRF